MAVIFEKRNLCGLIIDATLSERHAKTGTVTSEPISIGANASDHMFSNPMNITLRGTIGAIPPCQYRGGQTEPRRGKDDFPLMQTLENSSVVTSQELRNILTSGALTQEEVNAVISDRPILQKLLDGTLNPQEFTDSVRADELRRLRERYPESIGSAELNFNARARLQASLGLSHFGSQGSQFNTPEERVSAAWCRLEELIDNKEVCQVVTGLKVYDDVVVTSISAEQNIDNCEKLDFVLNLRKIKRVSSQTSSISAIPVNRGVVDKGDVETTCLRLNEVFSTNASGAINPRAIEIMNGELVTANFDRSVWSTQICGRISQRYQNVVTQGFTNNQEVAISPNSPTGFILSEDSLNNQISGITNQANITEQCNELLDASDFGGLCLLPERCRDTRFNRPSDDDNGQSTASVNATPTTVRTPQQREQGAISRVLLGVQDEIMAEDPTSQYFFASGNFATTAISNSDVSPFLGNQAGGPFRSEVIAQVDRLNCYYCAMLEILSRSNTDQGRRLRQVGLTSSTCRDVFSFSVLAPETTI